MAFRPRLWPTLFMIPALIAMLALGSWQVKRLYWKTDLIETFEVRVAADPISAPHNIDDLNAWRFQRVAADGHFLNDKELHLIGRTYEGNAGYHVLTPFVTETGLIIFVNRGWVPEAKRHAEARPNTLITDRTTIVGMIRESGVKSSRFVPDNEPHNDIWFTVKPQEMAEHLGLTGQVANYHLDIVRETPKPQALPYAANTKIEVRNEHLQYAITWFSLALTLLVIYVLWHRSMDRKERPEDGTEGQA